MDTTQVQVTYGPGKIRKFNIPETPCTYEELKSDIQCRIPSLVGKMFGIQYLDDEENWIIAVSDTCISEAFRCSREIEGTYMRRMKLRIFDGCSPQVSGFSTDKRDVMEPKCLFESSRDPVEAIESDCKRQLRKSVYRSPLQLLIDELEDEVHVKSVEFESAKEHLKSLEKKFTNPNIKIDKTKSQCGQCHMRLGHTKRNCELGVCEGPQMCNDLDKHDVEKKQFCDASTTVKNITKDLEKVKQNLHLKKQTYENTCDTFFSRVLPHLVNTNTDKYYPVGSFGLRQLSMGAIHPDIAILDKHYRGIIPKDLDSAARCFGQILEKYQKDNRGPTEKPKNPIQRFMEDRGVEFPKFKTPQTTNDYN
ncbi:Hypothetical predicted protein [Mytilus galloprovincialis]|uniref:PB1 domain-containing protein n=1 Tax=Mytilus galloprovincialis TaxID=29158 RepID=A0A8B6GM72_MYTGA|nr:Hypothetical predicted protein [Mytilus galloprovincialis]